MPPASMSTARFDRLEVIPEELADASDLVVFCGHGLSMQCGYPSLHAALAKIANAEHRVGGQHEWQLVRDALSANDSEAAVDLLGSFISRRVLLDQLSREYVQDHPPRPPWQFLPHLNIIDAITPAWDPLITSVFANKKAVEVTPSSSHNLERLFDASRFCIVRLNGMLNDETALLTFAEYTRAVARNPTFSRHLVSLVMARSHLFIGASAKTIYRYLSSLPLPSDSGRRHFAFITTSARFDVDAARLRRFGVHAYPINRDDPGKDLFNSLHKIYRAQSRRKTTSLPSIAPYNAYRSIRSIELRQIGPFEWLQIPLREDTNIVIGNNGCGKSSVLRALALACAGDHPSVLPAAEGLLRSSASQGSIKIAVGDDEYVVELVREGAGVRVKTSQASPIELGAAFPLAFPAFRGLSGADPAGPGAAGTSKASVDDVLPLILGTADGRLANIKQWLVNLEAGSEQRSDIGRDLAGRNKRLFQSFFRVIGEFLVGLPITFDRIERSPQKPWRVLVRTTDGVLSFNQLAQGMNSVISLVGTVVQRLYEVHAESDKPEGEHAIVIADEIDAHMHPLWQQQILQLFRKHFPRVQIIATTHSPLVVSGADISGVTRLARSGKGVIEIVQLQEDETRGRSDQLLVGPLFGLKTTLDHVSRGLLDEYRGLLAKTTRTPEEESKFEQLRKDCRMWIPPPEEGDAIRRARQLLSSLLRSEVGGDVDKAYEDKLMKKATTALLQALDPRRG